MTAMSPASSSPCPIPDSARAFLERHGFGDARLQPLEADASPRRYFRVGNHVALLMEDGQDPGGFVSYLQLSEHLTGLGLSAPRVLHASPGECLALIEDFGDETYTRRLEGGANEGELYRLAVDVLLKLHHDPGGAKIDRPDYDLSTHLDELSIFSDWFAPAVAPGLDAGAFDREFRALWTEALAPVKDRRDTLVLRDFHVDNLMLLEERSGPARCGLLDFQDAVLGPCEYDLVSLLQDARRDLAPGLEGEMLDHYCGNAPASLGDGREVRRRYNILGAQRHARILGVFVRLCRRDGKPRYLDFIPRVAGQYQTALLEAGLDTIGEFLDARLPDWRRAAENPGESLA